jgi:hypothetical protein
MISSREGFRYANNDENDLGDFLYWCSRGRNAHARLCATSPSNMERVPASGRYRAGDARRTDLVVALTGVVVTAGVVVAAGVVVVAAGVVVGIPGTDAHPVRRCRVDAARLTDGEGEAGGKSVRSPWPQAGSSDGAARRAVRFRLEISASRRGAADSGLFISCATPEWTCVAGARQVGQPTPLR